MPYQRTVDSSIRRATTASTEANLTNSIFAAAHAYTKNRVTNFSSWEEAKLLIPSTSPTYAAMRTAFQQSNVPTPVYLARRQVDSMTLTPTTVVDSTNYGLVIHVVTVATGEEVANIISVTSGTDATAEDIATSLRGDIGAVDNISTGAADSTGSVTVTADANYDFYISDLTRLTDTYATTESAADLLTAIQRENNTGWYFMTAEDHTEDFVLAMAAEIEATGSGVHPKMYGVSVADQSYLATLSDPATTILGKLVEGGYTRTFGIWNHLADSTFVELAATCYNGSFDAGTTTWKYMPNMRGVQVVSDPITGVDLQDTAQGYIADHNASWWAEEHGVAFQHGGTTASGEWIDVIRTVDFLNDRIETRVQDFLINEAANGKVSFSEPDIRALLGVIEGVLSRATTAEILTGYVKPSINGDITFTQQANRILDNVEWVGYLAGAIHFVVVNGTLTYQDETIE